MGNASATLLINDSDAPIVFTGTIHPGNFVRMEIVIQPTEQIYINNWDFDSKFNPGRTITSYAFLKDPVHKEKKTYILPSLIRDSAAVVFNYKNGRVTYKKIEKTMLDVLGIGVIAGKIQHFVKKWQKL